MIRSMTGFGRSIAEYEAMEFSLEIRTLNHRYLDINIRLPRAISYIEEEIRTLIKENFNRGRVDIYIGINERKGYSQELKLNIPLVESYIERFSELEVNYGVSTDISIDTLIGIEDIFIIEEEEQDEDALKIALLKGLEEAILKVKNMRKREGESLAEDINKRCRDILMQAETLSTKAYLVVDEYREKLKERLSDILGTGEIDEHRFNMEVAIMAEKSNITEEVVRLRSHIMQLEDSLKEPKPMGRKLDFLVQEINREVNTIGSKSNDLEISNMVVDIKSEIEKIREQVQNIE